MAFFIDRVSGKSGFDQYLNYLDNEQYLQDLKENTHDAINYQLIEVRRSMALCSAENQRAITISTNAICGSLQRGFESTAQALFDVEWGIAQVNQAVGDLIYLLDWKLDLIIEEQRITNFYLANIERSLNKPDAFKMSSMHMERGVVLLAKAISQNSKSIYYKLAQEEFTSALTSDNKNFISKQKLGLVYLESYYLNDPSKAYQCFLEASHLTSAFSESITSTFNTLYLNNFSREKLTEETAYSYHYAAKCCYILDKLEDAINWQKKAIKLLPRNLDFKFQLAKYYGACDKMDAAVEIVEFLVNKHVRFSVKTASEPDLISKVEIMDLFANLTYQLSQRIANELADLKKYIGDGNPFKNHYDKVTEDFKDKTYLNLRNLENILFGIDQDGLIKQIKNAYFQREKELDEKLKQDEIDKQLAVKNNAEKQKLRVKLQNFTIGKITVSVLLFLGTVILFNKSGHASDNGVVLKIFAALLFVCFCGTISAKMGDLDKVRSTFTYSLNFGIGGALLGLIVGFGKGCGQSVSNHDLSFSAPFKYMGEMAGVFLLVAVVIGAIVAMFYNMFKKF